MATSRRSLSTTISWVAFYFSLLIAASLVIAFFSFSLTTTLPSSPNKRPVVTVSVHAARNLLASGHRFLDVRTKEEFAKGHVKDAINVPYLFFTPQGRKTNPRFLEEVSAVLNKEDPILVVCLSGARSLKACIDLLKFGFEDVKNVEGGFNFWVANGFHLQQEEDEM